MGEGGLKKKQLSQSQRRGPSPTAFPETETLFPNTHETTVSVFQTCGPWVSDFTFPLPCEDNSLPGLLFT